MATNQKNDDPKARLDEALAELKKIKAERDQFEKELAAKDAHIEAQQKEIDKMEEQGDGWLITAPNPLYDGETAGIKFTSGVAFISKNVDYPNFKPPRLRDELYDKLKPEGQQKHDELHRQPSSWWAVQRLVNDFGYDAEYFSHDDLDALKAAYQKRQDERVAAARAAEEAEEIKKISVARLVS